MRLLNVFLVLLAVSLASSAVLPPRVPAFLRSDAFAILTAFLAVRAPRRRVMALCWLTGLARDALSGGSLGVYALLYLLAGAAILRIRSETENRPLLSYSPYAFAIALATETACLAVFSWRAGSWPAGGWRHPILMSSLMTALLTPPCAWLLNRLERWMGIRRQYRFG